MWRWTMVFALALAVIPAVPAAAQTDVSMSVQMPLGGIWKMNQWSRLEVELTNQGDAYSGVLQVLPNWDRTGNDQQRKLRQYVSLQPGETREYHFHFPSEYLERQMVVELLDGDAVVASKTVYPVPSRGEYLVAVLDQHANAFHFLAGPGEPDPYQKGNSFYVQHVEPESLPEESWILKNLDILAIGQVDDGALTEEQWAAIKEWIYRGGVVILSASEGGEDVIRRFADLLPIRSGQQGVLTDLGELRRLAGGTALPFSRIPLYDKQSPLFVSKQLGAGVLLFANYDVNAEPMASWQYNRQLWQEVLAKHQVMNTLSEKQRESVFNFTLVGLSKIIPGVSTPNLGWIMAIWLLYIVIVSLLLYLVLKRMDKREWAWGILPAFAVLLSIGVFVIGRPQVVKENAAHQVSTIHILDERMAEVQTAASFLMIPGGTFSAEVEKGFVTTFHTLLSPEKTNDIVFSHEPGRTATITFEHVPYLSVRQAIASGVKRDIGAFAVRLQAVQGRIKGAVANKTRFDVEELYLDVGLQRIPLGPFKKGEEKQVDAKVEEYYLPDDMFLPEYRQTMRTREEMAESLERSVTNPSPYTQIRLLAVSKQPVEVFRVSDRPADQHYWNVLMQKVSLTPGDDGRIVYPYGALPVDVTNQEGTISSSLPYSYEVVKGSITFGLSVGQPHLDVKRVEIPLDHMPYRPFDKAIYHVKSNSWKTLGREERVVLEENVSEFLHPDGRILIRFANPTEQPLSVPQPFFQLEGVERLP